MSKGIPVSEAAEKLGLSATGVRYKIQKGTLKGRWTNEGWRVYLNGDDTPESDTTSVDTIEVIADEIVTLGKRLKRALKHHDDRVRQEAIADFATTLAETVKKGR